MIDWAHAGTTAMAAFLASLVEFVVGTRRSARRHFAVPRRAAPRSAAGRGQDGR